MTDLRAFLRHNPFSSMRMSGWRGVLWLGLLSVIVVALPQARALLTAGILGGIVLGAFLILMRQRRPGGPRGTPIVLFPRPVTQVSELLSRSHFATHRIFA
jgi:hypothetical protein